MYSSNFYWNLNVHINSKRLKVVDASKLTLELSVSVDVYLCVSIFQTIALSFHFVWLFMLTGMTSCISLYYSEAEEASH